MNKKTIVIEGNNFKDFNGFYDEIGLKFNCKGWLGKNLVAFDELLYLHTGPVVVKWMSSNKSKNDLGYAETIEYYKNNLVKVHRNNKKAAVEKLELAKNNEGKTLFEEVMSVFKNHPNIELLLE